jgi:hydrogenase maturation protease
VWVLLSATIAPGGRSWRRWRRRCAALRPHRWGVDICACDRPGAALVHMLAGVQHAVIIDVALSAGSPAGNVRWLDEHEIEARRSASSHGFGLAEALGLARALGDAPSRVSVLAISATHWEGDALSDPVREAVPVAVREVLALIHGDDADARGDPAAKSRSEPRSSFTPSARRSPGRGRTGGPGSRR